MTILFVTHYAGFYGANKSLLTLMCLLRERHQVQPLVLLPSLGPMCEQLEQANIPYVVSHYYWWVNDNKGLFQWLLNKRKQWRNWLHIPDILRAVLAVSKKYYGVNPSLVYTNSVCVNVGIYLAERLGLPHMWQFRESLSQFSLSLSLGLSLKLWAKPVNKRYIMISDYMMQFYEQYVPKKRMVRVYNGVSMERGIQSAIQSQTPINEWHVCCVGILSPQKNQMDAVQAINILYQEGIDVHLHLIGTYKDDYLRLLQEYVRTHHLQALVHFDGHQPDVYTAMQPCSIGLMTSYGEAFGRVTIEMMLMGMPIIASNSGANPELIKQGENGYVYELNNPHQLAQYIKYYIMHPELCRQHGAYARQYAQSNFSAEQNADTIYEQINQFLNYES